MFYFSHIPLNEWSASRSDSFSYWKILSGRPAVERSLRVSLETIWMFSRTDKLFESARNPTKIPQTSSRVLINILGVSRQM